MSIEINQLPIKYKCCNKFWKISEEDLINLKIRNNWVIYACDICKMGKQFTWKQNKPKRPSIDMKVFSHGFFDKNS